LRVERIQKILSAFGVASRREAEEMILEGRVKVNGKTAVLGQSAQYGADRITVDGVPLAEKKQHVYIMLNKPCGYLTTVSDDRGRKTVMELVADVDVRVYPVGRLDLDTGGLLLFTNDGEFANRITHPSFNNQKTYQVLVHGNAAKAEKLLAEPIEINGRIIHAVSVKLLSETTTGGVLEITIIEGRNRQVRRMCAKCGLTVHALKRISIGKLELGTLETGKWRYLTEEEMEKLG
jgi:23S rRNA pseudouridine2605 synthase